MSFNFPILRLIKSPKHAACELIETIFAFRTRSWYKTWKTISTHFWSFLSFLARCVWTMEQVDMPIKSRRKQRNPIGPFFVFLIWFKMATVTSTIAIDRGGSTSNESEWAGRESSSKSPKRWKMPNSAAIDAALGHAANSFSITRSPGPRRGDDSRDRHFKYL